MEQREDSSGSCSFCAHPGDPSGLWQPRTMPSSKCRVMERNSLWGGGGSGSALCSLPGVQTRCRPGFVIQSRRLESCPPSARPSLPMYCSVSSAEQPSSGSFQNYPPTRHLTLLSLTRVFQWLNKSHVILACISRNTEAKRRGQPSSEPSGRPRDRVVLRVTGRAPTTVFGTLKVLYSIQSLILFLVSLFCPQNRVPRLQMAQTHSPRHPRISAAIQIMQHLRRHGVLVGQRLHRPGIPINSGKRLRLRREFWGKQRVGTGETALSSGKSHQRCSLPPPPGGCQPALGQPIATGTASQPWDGPPPLGQPASQPWDSQPALGQPTATGTASQPASPGMAHHHWDSQPASQPWDRPPALRQPAATGSARRRAGLMGCAPRSLCLNPSSPRASSLAPVPVWWRQWPGPRPRAPGWRRQGAFLP